MSVLTQKYGKLEGWKWAGLVAIGGAVGWYVIRARKGAAAAAAQTDAAATQAGNAGNYGAPGAYNAPYPGQGEFMAKVLDQLGAISKNTTPKKPPVSNRPAKPTSAPRRGYVWVYDAVHRKWVQHLSRPAQPTRAPRAGYRWVYDGVHLKWIQQLIPRPAAATPRPTPRLVAASTPTTKGTVRAA